ncbi:MAG: hypothetical protein ACTTH5_04520 [Wolinella sp.]
MQTEKMWAYDDEEQGYDEEYDEDFDDEDGYERHKYDDDDYSDPSSEYEDETY